MSSEKKQNLDETVAALQDRWGSTAVRRLGQLPNAEVDHIQTGFPALDEALGIGGLPTGRISELVGSPTSGMASIALAIASQVQDHAGTVVYIDVGHNFDPDFAAYCGVDMNRLMLVRPGDAYQALHILQDFIASDGIGALVFDADHSLYSDPQPAKTMATTLDRIIAPLSQTTCLVLFLTSLKSLSGSVGISTLSDLPRASIIPHHSAVRLFIQREKWLYKQGDISGYKAQIHVVKNKLGPAGKQVTVSIQFAEAVSVKAVPARGENSLYPPQSSNGSSKNGGGS